MPLKKKILIGMAGAMAAFVGVVVFSNSATGEHTEDWLLRKYGDGMERKLKRISGSSAVDCGRVKVDEAPQQASQCVMDAFSAHKPFRVRYDIRGIDTALAAGLAQAQDGKIYALSFMGTQTAAGKHVCPLRRK